MSELKVATIDQCYHVYMEAWEAAGGQVLPCQRGGGNVIDSYAVTVVESNNTAIDNDNPVLNANFMVNTLANCPESTKFARVSTRERFHYTVHSMGWPFCFCGNPNNNVLSTSAVNLAYTCTFAPSDMGFCLESTYW